VLTLRTPAKINPVLEVLGPRPDGYHELALVFQAVGLYDQLTFQKKEKGVQLSLSEGPNDLAADDSNLIVKAAKLFITEVLQDKAGVQVTLQKNIPMAAGLGGGSSDAAATLRGLQWLFEVPVSEEKLADMAGRLGSDVPFFLTGGAALGTGRGEKIEPWTSSAQFSLLLVKTPEGLSTPAVYRSGKAQLTSGEKAKSFQALLKKGNTKEIVSALFNGLEPAAFYLRPDVKRVKERLMEEGVLGALVSGSGPTVFAVTSTAGEAKNIGEKFQGEGFEVFVTETISGGVERQ
jgi:4-diphosphocytidyl-2-C-methyl-D-erythritol kinase